MGADEALSGAEKSFSGTGKYLSSDEEASFSAGAAYSGDGESFLSEVKNSLGLLRNLIRPC